MGHKIRQPMAASALTLGGIPVKSSPLTVTLTCLALAAWVTVGIVLMIGAENRWTVATAGAASSLCVAAVACKAIEVIGLMLARHADHMTAITEAHADHMTAITEAHADHQKTTIEAHAREMRDQIYTLNWMMASSGWGKERAKDEASHLYGDPSPSDTGPFKIVNGTG